VSRTARRLLQALVALAITVAALAAGSEAGVRRAANFALPVAFSGTWTDSYTDTEPGSRPPCGSSHTTGSLTSKISGRTSLAFSREPGSASVEFYWGGTTRPMGPVTFVQHTDGIAEDNSTCGGSAVPADNSGCVSATRKGLAIFQTPGGSESSVSPVNERSFKLEFSWELTPGFDGVGCEDGTAWVAFGYPTDPLLRSAQRIDYLALYRCVTARRGRCGKTLHGSSTYALDNNGIVASARVDWTVKIGAGR
jgi:hypothetical protein